MRRSRHLDAARLEPRFAAVFASCSAAGLLRGGGVIAAATLDGEPVTATYRATASGEPARVDHRSWYLLTHTSGIDLVANTAEGPSAGLTPRHHLQAALDAGLDFVPGTRYELQAQASERWAGADALHGALGRPRPGRRDRVADDLLATAGLAR